MGSMSTLSVIPYVLTGLFVSVLHAALPTHWLPFVLAGRAQKWSYKRTISVLMIAALGHILTTTAIGAAIIWFSLKLNENFEHLLVIVASLTTFLFGLYYIIQYFTGHKHTHCDHDHPHIHDYASNAKDGWAVLSLLSLLTFSPCESFLPIYLSAWETGWSGFFILSAVLALGTLLSMMFFTSLAYMGMKQLRFRFLEDHEKIIVGVILILLSVVVYISELSHHTHG